MRELPLIPPMSVDAIGAALYTASSELDPIDRMVEFIMANDSCTRYDFFVIKLLTKQVIVASMFTTRLRHIALADIYAVTDAKVSLRPESFKNRIREHFTLIKQHNNVS